jgi:ketosteroid isomerase-like protein
MSQENMDRLRRMIEDFNSVGIEAALVHVHPELVWLAPPEWLEKSVYEGHEGIRELAASWGQNFEQYRVEIDRIVELEDGRALALLMQRGTIKDSGAEVEQPVAWITEFQTGLVARVQVYFSWETALEKVGQQQ